MLIFFCFFVLCFREKSGRNMLKVEKKFVFWLRLSEEIEKVETNSTYKTKFARRDCPKQQVDT